MLFPECVLLEITFLSANITNLEWPLGELEAMGVYVDVVNQMDLAMIRKYIERWS